jgi:hypothetical protein
VPLTCVWRRVSLELSALMWPCVRASCMVGVCEGFLPGHPDVDGVGAFMLVSFYQRAAVSQPSMQNDVSMAPISTRAQYTADPRSQSNGTLQQGTNLEFSGDSRGLMGMGVVHESQMPTFSISMSPHGV